MILYYSYAGFPGESAGKKSACNMGDLGLVPGLVRCPGEGECYPLQYSGLENSMDCIVHGVTESDMTEWLWFSLTLGGNGVRSLWDLSVLFAMTACESIIISEQIV